MHPNLTLIIQFTHLKNSSKLKLVHINLIYSSLIAHLSFFLSETRFFYSERVKKVNNKPWESFSEQLKNDHLLIKYVTVTLHKPTDKKVFNFWGVSQYITIRVGYANHHIRQHQCLVDVVKNFVFGSNDEFSDNGKNGWKLCGF